MLSDQGFFRQLLDNLYDGVYFVDLNRIITFWNRGAERLSGFPADEVIGRHCGDNLLVHVDMEGRHLCRHGCPLAATLADGQERQSEIYLHHRDGHRLPVLVRISPIRNGEGQITGAVEIFSDNTARILDQHRIDQLQEMAFLDPLTSLPNRRYLEIKLNTRLEEMQRYGWQSALLFLDVDHFKAVNDQYGHAVGDNVLKMVARTLAHCARSVDTVGRWGGEEFVAILTNIGKGRLLETAERYRQMVENSGLPVSGKHLQVTVSIGAAVAMPGDTAETLISRADDLMYQSKLRGRNCVTIPE